MGEQLSAMKSNKQRRAELRELRAKQESKRQSKAIAQKKQNAQERIPADAVLCDPNLLAPYSSYGAPSFVIRGYYIDIPFQCVDCQKQEVWSAARQKWWYEVAKGYVYSYAKRCHACRKIERDRQTEARRIHLEGLAKKHSSLKLKTPQS